MLIIQDLHVVRGRDELPFEDTYRDEIVPALADHGAQLAFFGWAPHGAGQGYEALVLTVVEDAAALRAYQDALSHGALSETWTKLEASNHELHSTLLVPNAAGFEIPAPPEGADGPVRCSRLDTLTVTGGAAAAAESISPSDPDSDDLIEVLAAFSPAVGDLAEPVVTVFSRIGDFEALHRALGELTEGPWSGTPELDGVLRREVRISRCAPWSPLR